MTLRVSIAAALMTGICAPPLHAQMPKDVQEKLAAIGNGQDARTVQATFQLYLQEARRTDRSGATATRDLQYGPDRLQTLDLYAPQGKSGVPVVLFVHGGGFTGGDKNPNQTLLSNVPIYFARNGALGATMNYRLAPAAPWPAGAEDVALAVAWLRKNAQSYGGDAGRIFLFGYSAGATHVASYALDRSFWPASGSGVAGAVVLSGLYQVQPPNVKQPAWGVTAYFGDDSKQYDRRSPLTYATEKTPFLLGRAELDPPTLVRTAADLRAELCKRPDNCPRLVVLPFHTHLSTAPSFNTSDEQMGREILAFIAGVRP